MSEKSALDAYMLGMCLWMSPRQILICDKMCSEFVPEPEDAKAFEDFYSQIKAEAEIKRKKYAILIGI